jgi:hypothetical protein
MPSNVVQLLGSSRDSQDGQIQVTLPCCVFRETLAEAQLEHRGRKLMQRAHTMSAMAAEQAQSLVARATVSWNALIGGQSTHQPLPNQSRADDDVSPHPQRHFEDGEAASSGTGPPARQSMCAGAEYPEMSPSQDPWASLRRALVPETLPQCKVRWSETDM